MLYERQRDRHYTTGLVPWHHVISIPLCLMKVSWSKPFNNCNSKNVVGLGDSNIRLHADKVRGRIGNILLLRTSATSGSLIINLHCLNYQLAGRCGPYTFTRIVDVSAHQCVSARGHRAGRYFAAFITEGTPY